MTVSTFYQTVVATGLGSLLAWNLGAIPSLANAAHQSNDSPIQGLPGRRLGGGTRGGGSVAPPSMNQMPLTALMPETNLGVTTAAHPCFLFYLPNAENVREVEYVLRNEADELVYETTVAVASDSGIFSIDLASVEGLAPLTIDENYHWYFSIVAEDRAYDVSVDGWTRRVNLETWLAGRDSTSDLASKLGTAAPLEKARLLYQEAYLWHDAALILEELYQANPQDEAVATEWASLLAAVNLPNLTSASTVRLSAMAIFN
ncbi:DUF928 domain-containing protein [Leptothoe kymatousa]|uniref:DUF928 domain-containing protein n=1 Tax=Leptothoe kymatousa TAU-MAC 1615 TaxID=2364775 RepID=A0ABS5Y6N8_9CYAN|nr:DUF928 domain-containing protein [Leptothoe kymatousa]MBT9313524.1 DUF928 domain-containing protein [Leptothoe kymatousa TAU-MAC 1615]